MDRLINKGVSGSSSVSTIGRCLCVLPGIKSIFPAKCKGKTFNPVFPFPVLHSKKTLNKGLSTPIKRLCQIHTSTCLSTNSRECNAKREVNTFRIDHFLEKHKSSKAAATAYFSNLHQPCCSEIMNALGMESLSLRQIRQISRNGPFNVLGLFFLADNCQLDDNPYLVTGPFIM